MQNVTMTAGALFIVVTSAGAAYSQEDDEPSGTLLPRLFHCAVYSDAIGNSEDMAALLVAGGNLARMAAAGEIDARAAAGDAGAAHIEGSIAIASAIGADPVSFAAGALYGFYTDDAASRLMEEDADPRALYYGDDCGTTTLEVLRNTQ